jgi:lipopolysaccharide/colanic/teichoic acid biosynthesis glycosyltransferase
VEASLLPLIGGDLRAKLPSSRTRVFSRLALFDVMWAGISPILAFLIRDGAINRIEDVVVYGLVSLVISIIVFQWYRISSPIPNYFSIHDAFTISKACLVTVALTVVALFIFTRLNYAPRSIPVIHLMVLGCGLIAVRVFGRLANKRYALQNDPPRSEEVEVIMIIGATRLAWFFSKMVEELSSDDRRIVAILDEREHLINRTLNGYSIVGSPESLSNIADEYAAHGVEIDKIVVAVHPKDLTAKTQNRLGAICKARNISIEWLHETFALSQGRTSESLETTISKRHFVTTAAAGVYWKIKRAIDIVVALAAMVTIAPLTISVAALVMIDVGFPIIFWQQRVGHLGRPLHVYKFRTMRSSFDRKGQPVPQSERLSQLGRLLRQSHLDEIPQLFNILTGGMSLVGPRPLLPADQPKDIQFRLQVRPGLTGLAQINGGTLLTAEEKDALDDWYVQHATLLVDIKIIFRTIWIIALGNHRNEIKISDAIGQQRAQRQSSTSVGAQDA